MVVRVLKEASAKIGFGEAWHTDLSYLPQPPAFTCLWSSEIPPTGGDTMWADQAAAYAALDDETKREIAGLMGVHSAGRPYGTGGFYSQVQDKLSMEIAPSDEAFAEFRHPLVVKHPDSGEPVLFANQTYTLRVDGWEKDRSDALLKRLFAHATDLRYVYRLTWRPHMLTIWDNRATQHFAINDYHGHRREMFRTSVKGAPLLAA
jgi:taurine dioxygenase